MEKKEAAPAEERMERGSLESLPLDYLVLKNILERYRAEDLKVVVQGDREKAEERMIIAKTREIGLNTKMKDSQERKVVVKLTKSLKYVILKIKEIST